jgi:DNA excision repair protein ERCC-2
LKPTFTIAVRTLVEHLLRQGDLRSDFMGSVRGVEGIRAHQRVQRQRPPCYQAEVPVRHSVVQKDFNLSINGRIDGVMVKDGLAVVEEIKTTRMALQEVVPSPVHWGQVQCYAYMWALEQGHAAVEVHLTYVGLGSGKMRTIERHVEMDELARFFNDLLEKYLVWLRALTQWIVIRDASIREQGFPFGTYRPGQRELAKAVYRAIRDRGHLLVQATTGIGKTMASLFPAIKALAEKQVPKVVFLTARTTGRQAAETALQTLRADGLRLRSVTVTAKDKVCIYPQSTCSPEACLCAKGHFDRINGALLEALSYEAILRETIVALAQKHLVCPFELTLELVGWADCVIGDYNYAFAPGVVLQRLFGEEADQHAVLVDEAHNLVDRSREMFSAQLAKQPVLSMRRCIKQQVPAIYKSLGRLNAWMAAARRRYHQQGDATFVDNALPDKLMERLQDFLWGAERWLMRNEPADFRQSLLDLFFACARFLRVAEGYDERYVTLYEGVGDEFRIKLFCIDPSHRLRQAWKNCHAAILFSATLTPADYFQNMLGCHPDAGQLLLPSPFPQENFAVFSAQKISTLYRDRERSCKAVSRALAALVRHRTGHYLLFFPSYAYMEMVHQQFRHDCADIQTLVQTPEMQESARELFLNRFRTAVKGTLAGFAVLGGIFGEGIDLKGEQLTGAAIVGVGLPGICPERDVIRAYYDQTDGSGYQFAYQYPGINRVLQAAGRVIRSETDRGVLLLIDSRYGRQGYRSLIPSHWQVHHVNGIEGFGQKLSAFWERPSTGLKE